MNIHVTDQCLQNELFNSELVRIPFGSHVYGLNNQHSDKDYICIYAESDIERKSFLWEHHNFQIKEDNTDYIFTSLRTFIRNLINGDMPGNLEAIYHNDMNNSLLSYFYVNRHQFSSYTNVRAYLGFAKRDLKHALRNDSRLCHAYRSYLSAKRLLDNSFDPCCINWNEYDILVDMKEGNLSHAAKKKFCHQLTTEVNSLRDHVNQLLQENAIIRFMDVGNMKKLDDWLLTTTNSNWYNDKAKVLSSNEYKYQALESGITY